MAKWICSVCSYVHEGEKPTEPCPVCMAPPEAFVLMEDEAKETETKPAASQKIPETLEEVRDLAREKLMGVCAVYPACDGADDRICNREAYGKPIGMGGVGSGSSFRANVESLKTQRLKMRVVGDHFVPDTSCDFLGVKLSMPIMGAPTSGVSSYNNAITENDFCEATIRGCRDSKTITWRGFTHMYKLDNNPALDALEKEQGHGIPIFKPLAQGMLKRLIERAEKAGVPAVGIDLDGCGSTNMARAGMPVFRKTPEEIRELVEQTNLPFITKGIMTAEDAEACVDAGVKVVAVSNHGGRVLDYTPGVAEVLPEIAAKVGGRVIITADGGVRTGFDVLKMLALGADAVLVGRDVVRAAIGGGDVGVRLHMDWLRTVLQRAMMMTGCKDLKSINSDILI